MHCGYVLTLPLTVVFSGGSANVMGTLKFDTSTLALLAVNDSRVTADTVVSVEPYGSA
jgi:hypothetical protein